MDDSLLVGVGDSAGKRQEQFGTSPRGKRRSFELFIQARTSDEFHSQERMLTFLPDFVNLHNVRMRQAGSGLRLAAKSYSFALAVRQQHHLQGDDPIQAELLGAINDAHSTAANFVEKLVPATEVLARTVERI